MGGFAAAIGGVSQPAQEYGHQIRGMLEQRRGHFVDLMTQLAGEETDPQRRAEYLDHASRLLTGEDMAKVMKSGIPMIQNHMESNAALADMMGGPPKPPPPPPPGPAVPGQTPGTQVKQGEAAQPATSPVQPSQAAPSIQPVQAATPQPVQPVQPPQPPPQPTAQPIQPVGGGFDARAKRAQIIAESEQAFKQATPAMRPFILQATKEKLDALAPFEQQAMRMSNLEGLQGAPGYSQLPAFAQTGYEAQARGFTPINMPMGALVPTKYTSRAEELDPAVRQQFGLTGYIGPVTISKSRLDGSIIDVVPGNEGVAVITNPDGTQSFQMKTPGGSAGVARSQVTPHTLTDKSGMKIFQSAEQARTGESTKTAGIDTSFAPVTTTGETSVTTVDDQGHMITKRIPTVSTRTKGAVGSTPSRAGGSTGAEFIKPLTPVQNIKSEQQLGQYNLALNRMQSVRSQTHLLDSMLESGKLQLETDSGGLVRAVVNRLLPMTQAEAEFVGNFRTLMEDINLLRGPMGATGFRGPEAWAALQGQRGQLLANPMITRQVLDNSIAALKAQITPLQNRPGAPPAAATPGAATHVYDPATGTIKAK